MKLKLVQLWNARNPLGATDFEFTIGLIWNGKIIYFNKKTINLDFVGRVFLRAAHTELMIVSIWCVGNIIVLKKNN